MIFLHMFREWYTVFGCNVAAAMGDPNYFQSLWDTAYTVCCEMRISINVVLLCEQTTGHFQSYCKITFMLFGARK